jgi:excisionase family DNA binding protein
MNDEIWTIREVAEFLKVKPVTIYKLANQGRIPGVKIAGSWRFNKKLMYEWIETDCKRAIKLKKDKTTADPRLPLYPAGV